MAPPTNAIPRCEDNSVFRDVSQRLQDVVHAGMEEVGEHPASFLVVRDMLQARDWEIPHENLTLKRCLASKFLRDVADGEVDWVGGAVAKLGEKGLVGGNDE